MILYASRGPLLSRRRFQPRHFLMLAEGLAPAPVRWAKRLSELPRSGWGLVIRAPGQNSLGRELARRAAGGRFVFAALPADERRALEAKDGVLILDLDWDPLIPDDEVVAGLLQSIQEFGLDPARIRLLHCNQAARAAFEAAWRVQTTLPAIRTLEFPTSFALGVVYQHARRNADEVKGRLERARAALHQASRSKTFNSFNGGLRPHRLHLVAWLHHEGLLDRGHVSLLGYSKGPRWVSRLRRGASGLPPEDLRRSLAKAPYAEEVAGDVEAVWKRLPITLDRGLGFGDYEQLAWESQDERYYDDSWFSVVTESHAARPEVLHITEKAMKPMMNAQPFLTMGSQGAMAQLVAYGFESFAPQFDEAYDACPWPKARMRLVLDEVRRLCSLAPEDLRELCLELWPRSEHNYLHFWGAARERLAEAFRRDVLDQLC